MASWFVLGLLIGTFVGITLVKGLVWYAGELVEKVKHDMDVVQRTWAQAIDAHQKAIEERQKLAQDRADALKIIETLQVKLRVQFPGSHL